MSEAYPKKYWWLVLIVVPLIGAVIAILPSFFNGNAPPAGQTYISNTKFSGDLYFANVDVIVSEYKQMKGEPLTDEALREEIVRGVNLVKGGDYEAAVGVFDGIADKAGLPSVYNNLGVLRAMNNDYAGSRTAYRKAIEENPDLQPVQYNLGLLEQQQGRIDAAVRHLEKAPAVPQAKKLVSRLRGDTQAGAAEAEPNNDILTPNGVASLDTWIQGAISGQDDRDFYHFTTPKVYRDVMQIEVKNLTTTLRPQISLWSADKRHITNNVNYNHQLTPGQDTALTFSTAPQTEYYLSIGGFGTEGQYRLRVAPLKRYDDYEPNDAILEAKPISLGTAVEANIMDNQDVDYYVIRTSGDTHPLAISVKNHTNTLRPQISLWAGDKGHITNNVNYDHQITPGQDASLTRKVEPRTTYFISIRGFGTQGDYRLTVRHEGE